MATDREKRAREAFVDDNFELEADLDEQAVDVDPNNAHLSTDSAQANINLKKSSVYGMASKNEDFDDVAQWPIPIEEHFIQLLHEEAQKGLQTSTLEKKRWVAIEHSIFSNFGKRYTVPKLKSKYNRLRKLHREFAKLTTHPRMALDPETNTIHASEDVWETHIKKHPFAKRFRKKGWDHYHVLGEIFNNTTDTEQNYAATQSPPNSDAKKELEAEFLSSGIHKELHTEGEAETLTEGHGDTNKTRRHHLNPPVDLRPKKEPKTSELSNLDDVLEAWAKSLSAKTKVSLAKADRIRNQEASSSLRELASIEDCMEILEAMDGVDDDAYVKACERFTSSDWRRIFIKMSDARRRMWLDTLK